MGKSVVDSVGLMMMLYTTKRENEVLMYWDKTDAELWRSGGRRGVQASIKSAKE